MINKNAAGIVPAAQCQRAGQRKLTAFFHHKQIRGFLVLIAKKVVVLICICSDFDPLPCGYPNGFIQTNVFFNGDWRSVCLIDRLL